MGQERLKYAQRTSRYPVDPNDDSRCIQCGSSFDQEEEHAKVCLIGESQLTAKQAFIHSGHPGVKIFNQSFAGAMKTP